MSIPPASAPTRIAVLISGGGTTLRNLIQRIQQNDLPAQIVLVISNRESAKGLQFAHQAGIPTQVVSRAREDSDRHFCDAIFDPCRRVDADLVVMAGFLRHVLIPDDFVGRVMNIHPSLIPAFCGQGYYGRKVHEAVLSYGVKVSGCTVHFVDNQYDHGPIILQRTVSVFDDDTPERLAERVFDEECRAYPEAIRRFADGELVLEGRLVKWKPIEDAS